MKSKEFRVSPLSNYYNYTPSMNAKEELLYPICTGDFIYEPGYKIERNSFDSFLVEIILEGSLEIETDGRRYHAQKDDVVILDCYKQHRYSSETGWRALWVHFDGVGARGYYNWITRCNGNVFSTWNVRKIQKSLESIYGMFHSERSVNEPRMMRYLVMALTAMMDTAHLSDEVRNTAEAIDEVIYYINEHLADDITVEKMAQIANFSKYHFIRLFRESIGMTPRQYLIAVRMDYAKYLLKGTDLPVQEIGYSIGYASEGMFCTSFKRVQGVTPSEYRKDIRANDKE